MKGHALCFRPFHILQCFSSDYLVVVVVLVGWGGVGWVAGATLRLRLYVHKNYSTTRWGRFQSQLQRIIEVLYSFAMRFV